ncbi:G-protein-signaling modulator 2-like [Montipora capricornis]|uniref:G-protein-signaling modulator 2-like n=1 Tax=Montipora capricornis TaxID=246305 RepID=UPI0035F16C28
MQELSVATKEGNRQRRGLACFNLGRYYYGVANFNQAIRNYTEALAMFKEIGFRAGEGKAYSESRHCLSQSGNFQASHRVPKERAIAISAMLITVWQAIEYHHQHLSIAKEVGDRAEQKEKERGRAMAISATLITVLLGDRAGEGSAYGNLGNAYHSLGNFNLGNFKQAIEYHNQHLSIAKDCKRGRDLWAISEKEIKVYGNLGNQRLYCKVLEGISNLSIAKEVGDRAGEGERMAISAMLLTVWEFQASHRYHNQHLSIAKEVRDIAGEGTAYGNLGNAYCSLGNFKEAIEYHNQHLSIAKKVGNIAGEGQAYGNLGNADYSLGNFKQAIDYHNQYLSIAKEVGDIAGEGRAYCNLDSLSKALNCYRQSVNIYDETRHLQSEETWKISFRDTKWSAYNALWTALLKSGEVDEALYAAEQGRAQALGDILKMQYGVDEKPLRHLR